MSLVILEDIIKKTVRDITDSDAAKLCKIIALVFGVIVIGGAFIVQYVGTMVLQLAYSIFGICGGPLLGIFFLGMFVRRANSKGAYAGVLTGAGLTTWVFLGSVFFPPNKYPGTRSVKECLFYKDAVFHQTIAGNFSAMNASSVTADQINASMAILAKYGDGYMYNPHKPHGVGIADDFYHISYLWFSGLSVLTAFVVGVVVSFAFESKQDRQKAEEMDPKLLFPLKDWLYGFLPDHKFTWDIDESPPAIDHLAKREIVVKPGDNESEKPGKRRRAKSLLDEEETEFNETRF